MMSDQFKRKFACLECGTQYDAYPPDDVHIKANSVQCPECKEKTKEDAQIKVNYECDNCSKLNEIFWHDPLKHTIFVRRIVTPKIRLSSDKDNEA